ncbi:ABC transporter [Actinotalea sp. K2]|uniref:ABC transporter n=1 Tax=Actinotalea sp. K2 TaxID=2939438 RepID=UPI002017E421|nr:ABC transporter [Actinotalea sp. K2]MCL3860347.1 ABC transporter [Actinotalea sp. K2]
MVDPVEEAPAPRDARAPEAVTRARAPEALARALGDLRTALAALRLPLDLPDAAHERASVEAMLGQIDDHLLPRVRQMGAPLLAVVGGSTGAGKSTLVNSLLGADVTAAGVLRPTTRSPVLVHHPDDVVWFTGDRILPRLPRVTGGEATGRALRLVGHLAVPRGLALLDAPDIDSVVAENRRLGEELLGAADLWVFVTTAARYADAVPWDLLDAAARRNAVVAMVLNRVDPRARDAVTADLATMLTERGLTDTRLLVVPESRLDAGRLPGEALRELDRWLRSVAADDASRSEVARRSVRGGVLDLVSRAPAAAAAADAQAAHARGLRAVAHQAYEDALRSLESATSDGTMLRGEVLARWQEFVGTGELLRAIETKVSSWRDRAAAFVRGRPAPEPVTAAIGAGLVDLVVDAADRASDRTYAAWRADPAGERLVEGLRLSRSSADLRERISGEVRAWQGGVLDLVSTEGAGRRSTARALSFGVNGLGAALMVTIFASTGGLTTAEVGVAGGAAVLAQRLLEAVFGDDAVRRLTRTAQHDLTRRLAAVLDVEAARFTTVLDALDLSGVTAVAGDRVRGAAREAGEALGAVPELGHDALAPAEPPEPEAGTDATSSADEPRPWWRRWWGA